MNPFRLFSQLKKQSAIAVILFALAMCPLVAKCQTPTAVSTVAGANPTYVYVGSLTKNSGDASSCQKLKVDLMGGGWSSSNDGETTFYIANRGGLSINEVVVGSAGIAGIFTLHAYQNGNNTDFYLSTPAADYSAIAVLSYFFAGYGGTSQFVTITTSATPPAETEITPLTINPVMITDGSGNIAINSPNTYSQYKFAINGPMIATAATVKLFTNWPDFVFLKDYKLPTVKQLSNYIDQNHHLPDVPSATEVKKDGINLGEMDKILTKKIEELTLYLIEKDKQLAGQEKRIEKLESQVKASKK